LPKGGTLPFGIVTGQLAGTFGPTGAAPGARPPAATAAGEIVTIAANATAQVMTSLTARHRQSLENHRCRRINHLLIDIAIARASDTKPVLLLLTLAYVIPASM
jgi:hypothetical protein